MHQCDRKIEAKGCFDSLLTDLLTRAFGGSTQKLVMQALSAKKASKEELAEIRRMLDELDGGAVR